ncbi:RecX family transcriptional regulator, partial [Pseudonocardia sp. NPDC049154]|uniref:RecX family transcriptional regulator n=1 Tax=Pseudonocardia sp. NPDC049154 TaxID=3155501 RepID=UPI0033CD357F
APGPRDSGPRDSGPRDSGPHDSGPHDSGPGDPPRTDAGAVRAAEARGGTAGPDPDRERRIGLVDLDALEPGAPVAHEAAELRELDAPAEQATVLSLEDLRIRRARRSGGAGRTEGGHGSARSTDREARRPSDGARGVRRSRGGTTADSGRSHGGRSDSSHPDSGPSGSGPSRSGPFDEDLLDNGTGERRTGRPRRTQGDPGAESRGRRRGATRGAEGEPAGDTRSPEEQEAAAKEICLRLLTDRARSKHELATKLGQKGVADEIAEKVLERFDEVGLIDDQAFADAWVRSRHRARGLGRRAIAQELRRKGVAKEVADEALTEVDDAAEEQRARELVDRRLRTLTVTGPEDRQKAGRRLLGMLARKGYPAPIAYRVVRTALAQHGAEEDELGPADLD